MPNTNIVEIHLRLETWFDLNQVWTKIQVELLSIRNEWFLTILLDGI